MGFFGFNNKMDKALTPYIKINSKKKIPVIVCCTNPRLVKNKILTANGKIKYEYELIDAFACDLSPGSVDKISFTPEVRYICYDHSASLCIRKSGDATGVGHARLLGQTGNGIGVAIIDTGVYPHPDLTANRRVIHYFKDLVNTHNYPYDDNGHGTFLCGCIAASGAMSDGLYCGIAPGANLYMIKAFNEIGIGRMSDIIAGVETILKLKEQENISILCLPFEIPACSQLKTNPLELAIEKAMSAGMTVITASGNSGPMPYTIHFPGNLAKVITVGGIDTTTGSKCMQSASFSGRGPTLNGLTKPDIAAPCASIVSLMSDVLYKPDNKKPSPPKTPYSVKSGTSIACAIISGYTALLLEKNPSLSPSDIKSLLCLSTTSLGESKFSQGNGLFVYNKAQCKNQD